MTQEWAAAPLKEHIQMTPSPAPHPFSGRWQLTNLKMRKTTNLALILCAFSASILSAQTLTVLHNFDNTDGSYPWGALVQAANGDFYGTAASGGANG